MNEEWRDVVGYEGLYEVSNLGAIRRKENQIRLTPDAASEVCLRKNGRGHTMTVGSIVYKSFIGPTRGNVLHEDGNHHNNRLDNLVTKENKLDKVAAIWRRHLEDHLLKDVQ